MEIKLDCITKKFGNQTILKDFSYRFEPGRSYAITGPNGSGKSTLLQMVSGSLLPSSGTLHYISEEVAIEEEVVYRHLSIAAPWLELIEEMTLKELVRFHFQFKEPLAGFDPARATEFFSLPNTDHKLLKQFSSGMRQRVKLGLAWYSNTALVLLDEPTMNLDGLGIAWYKDLISGGSAGRTILIGSNDPQEYTFCDEVLNL